MNELARFVSFSLGFTQNYRIVDRDGNPWFVLKDICKILGIKQPTRAVKDFPPEYVSLVVCEVTLSHLTYKPRARKTQKVLIINEVGLFRLITRSDKPIARQLQARIFEEVLPAYRKHGINWASLPKAWKYRGQCSIMRNTGLKKKKPILSGSRMPARRILYGLCRLTRRTSRPRNRTSPGMRGRKPGK